MQILSYTRLGAAVARRIGARRLDPAVARQIVTRPEYAADMRALDRAAAWATMLDQRRAALAPRTGDAA